MQLVTVQRKSPDLNPIENVLGYIRNIVPQNLDELERFVQQAFKEISMPEYCKKLYDSISKRLQLVIENKGFAQSINSSLFKYCGPPC